MTKDKLCKDYERLALEYLKNQKEELLYNASLLSRQFIKLDMGPDEVIQLHYEILDKILKQSNKDKCREITSKLASLLLEIIMVYSDTHKKVRDVLSELEKRYQELDEAQKKIKSTTEQLIQAEKLTAVGQLAAGVAHELNNPLTAVRMNAAFLLEGFMGDSKKLKQINTIVKETDRAVNIVKQLLSFSRRPKVDERQQENINNIIKQTLGPVEHQLRLADIKVVCELSDIIPAVEVNANRIQQVFLNLVMNGRDAMPGGGELRIKSSVKDNMVEIVFSDGGCGIAEDKISKIFDPFFTMKAVGKGTGLGLSVSNQIIREHGGAIGVKSSPGKGTVFTVTLPIVVKRKT